MVEKAYPDGRIEYGKLSLVRPQTVQCLQRVCAKWIHLHPPGSYAVASFIMSVFGPLSTAHSACLAY